MIKYVLKFNPGPDDPNRYPMLHIFDTPEARRVKTSELIYQQKPNELCSIMYGLFCGECEILGARGFLKEPSIEWFKAQIITNFS